MLDINYGITHHMGYHRHSHTNVMGPIIQTVVMGYNVEIYIPCLAAPPLTQPFSAEGAEATDGGMLANVTNSRDSLPAHSQW